MKGKGLHTYSMQTLPVYCRMYILSENEKDEDRLVLPFATLLIIDIVWLQYTCTEKSNTSNLI